MCRWVMRQRTVIGDSFGQKTLLRTRNEKKNSDGGSFAKLFVGSVPKTATEEDVAVVFSVHAGQKFQLSDAIRI
ncbi:hypothetical protein Tco_1099147 [Tanacetum coccineum]